MTVLEKVLGVALLVALGAIGVVASVKNHQIAELQGKVDAAVVQRATEIGMVPAKIVPQSGIKPSKTNSSRISKLQSVDTGVKIAEQVDTHIDLDSSTPSKEATWEDPHHRFSLNAGVFRRKQEFTLQEVVVQSSDGVKILSQDFQELDPETHQPITDEPQATLNSSYRVVKDQYDVPLFHPRVLAGVGYLGQVGLGVEILNFEKFGGVWSHTNLSVLGLYNISKKNATGVAVFGIRPFNWNVSVGPAYFFPSNSFGAAATIELTR